MNPLLRLALAASLAVLAPAHGAQYGQRLGNLSTRAQVGIGDNIMITGFVVQEGAPKKVLIRAIGPRLSAYNVPGVLNNPQLRLFNASGVLVLANDDWSGSDAGTMETVGAFALNPGSNDAALVATLAPGAYTAQVSGVNNATGVALLEIYDVTGSARLLNLSTRAFVGTGANTFISGLSVAPAGGARRVLVRAAGPALRTLGVSGAVEDPALAVLDVAGRQVPGGANDNWETAGAADLAAAFAGSGAFPFASGSRDAALIVDLLPGNYTVQVNGVAGSTGTALVEIYDLSPEHLSTVSVAAAVASTDTTTLTPAVFQFTRVGAVTAPLTVHYTLGGTAAAGVDFTPLSGSVIIPAGATGATVSLAPLANPANANNRIATLTITPHPSYGVGAGDRASVTIFANRGSLYVATLRAAADAPSSTAYGTATIQLSDDETFAIVNVSFSNLSSPQIVGHLAIGSDYVFSLRTGQVVNAVWQIRDTGVYSAADVVAALKSGRITAGIDTAGYPAGELSGGFVRSSGSAAFNPPPAAPALDLTAITPEDAARFLTQATFGATQAGIAALQAQGYHAWINEQMALPASSHRAATMADFAAINTGGVAMQNGVNTRPGRTHRQAAWWKIAVEGPDQLRQRVAFALSEILVISDENGTINQWQEGAANYYDLLAGQAFGNYRTLLEQVSRSPMMGIYLSSLRNAKASNNATPDENYAREIMQLFSIGLHELNPDGTLRLDPNGQPIPTYTQETISETAKVFTGWSFHTRAGGGAANPNLFRRGAADYINPMILWPDFHDDTEKTIVRGQLLPAGQGGYKDLQDTLDALFLHPNTGPFIGRQLIQRLVTSNPSPAYVYRVAQAFADNGAGVRGDLGAVVRAILLDYEARSAAVAATATFGKLKEPLLRTTALFRAFEGGSNSGRFSIANPQTALGQAALRSPSVFNFFEPDFVLPGATAAAGLYAPEYQILTDTTALTQANFLYGYIQVNRSATNRGQQTIGLQFDAWRPLAATPGPLVDSLNLLLAAGSLSPAAAESITAAIAALPADTADAVLERIRAAIYLTLTAPESAVQK